MDKKKIITVGVALIAVIIIISGAAMALLTGEDAYDSKLELAQRYLEQGDYYNAILVLQDAIAIDPEREEAYITLYNTYVQCGSYDNARLILLQGIQATQSATLQNALVQLDAALQSAQPEPVPVQTEPVQEEPVDTKPVNYALNQDMLTFFSSANYNDYCQNYGAATINVSGDQYSVRVGSLPATLNYQNTSSTVVIDQTRGVPFNQFQPNSISMDNVTMLFGGGSIDYQTLKNLSGVSAPSMTGNQITFTYRTCSVTITCNEDGLVTSDSPNVIVPETADVTAQTHKLEAKVTDVTNGSFITNATVKAYAGYGTYGTAVEGKTDSTGVVTLELNEAGTYTVEVSADGYITETFEVYVLSNGVTTQKNFAISPELAAGAVRFVLSWNGYPTDLDLWLVGTASDGTGVSVSYANMVQYSGKNVCIAELDVDDRDGYGPETMTLYDVNGSYQLYVHDYLKTGDLALSGAQIKVYIGSQLYTVLDLGNIQEHTWEVCTFTQGNLLT